jgi:hypothetical protein
MQHRLLGADGFDNRVLAQATGQLLDPSHALVAALGDNVGGTEIAGRLLPALVAAHRDDPISHEWSEAKNETTTNWPGSTFLTSLPTSSTTPTYSCLTMAPLPWARMG